MHVVWYTAMSMDGRLAGPGDDLDFLQSFDTGITDEFTDFLADIDAVIVGARTIRWLEREGHGSLPAEDKPVWVMTHDRALAARMAAAGDVTPCEGAIGVALDEMAAAGHERIWVCGGGDVAGQILALDRIDEVIISMAPVALGGGPALFEGEGIADKNFALAECRPFGTNGVRLRWTRQRSRVSPAD